jgi:Protein of unknown function (DUF2905)
MRDLGRLLILLGAVLFLLGIVLSFLGRTGLGHLPGDFVYRRGSFTLYFPLMTSILLSVVLSLILWLCRR